MKKIATASLTGLAALVVVLTAAPAVAAGPNGFGLAVLVNGIERPEYVANGTIYVEALKGQEYALRVTNPLNVRVAVALAVDGLNTIDAKHTDAWGARKWVLAPYETILISGWQVNQATARKFYFTGERSSYGAFLGKTENLGVVEAVFYREKEPYRISRRWNEEQRAGEKDQERSSSNERELGGTLERPERAPEPGAPADAAAPQAQAEAGGQARDHSKTSSVLSPSVPSPSKLSDEYAATGIGTRTEHGVTAVSIDLDSRPVATVRLRYEFRPQLIRLGVLFPQPDTLGRREAATGFGSWCPEPAGR